MSAADQHQVPAGGALAVDRDGFSAEVTAGSRPIRWSPSPRGDRRPAARRLGQRRGGHRPPHLARPGRRHPGAQRRGPAQLLRRHRPDHPRRVDRHGHRLAPVALRQGRPRRRRGGLYQLPDGQGPVRGLHRRPARRPQGRVQGLGARALFRRLPADRGDGRARPRDPAPRADEAGRPDQSARPAGQGLRHRPAAPGQRPGHAVEHGRLPDQAEARGPGRGVPDDPGPGQRPVRAAGRPAPQHLHQQPAPAGPPCG
jgi:hypothetical protein